MKVDKMSISVDADLGEAIRAAARRAGTGVSGWLAEAAADRLRAEALGDFLDGWEKQHGAFTPDELAVAERALGRVAGERVAGEQPPASSS